MPYLLITKDDNLLLVEDAISDIRATHKNEVSVYWINDLSAFQKAIFDGQSPSLFDTVKPTAVFVVSEKLLEKISKMKSFQSLSFKTIKLFPVGLQQFPAWSEKRFKKSGYSLTPKAKSLLSEYCEGNILAAHQCLQKLKLLYDAPLEVTETHIIETAAYSAKYNIFDLIYHLSPSVDRAQYLKSLEKIEKILKSLEEEGVEPAIVLWGLARHCRQKKWMQVLPLLVQADNVIKGMEEGNVWQVFLQIAMNFVAFKKRSAA